MGAVSVKRFENSFCLKYISVEIRKAVEVIVIWKLRGTELWKFRTYEVELSRLEVWKLGLIKRVKV